MEMREAILQAHSGKMDAKRTLGEGECPQCATLNPSDQKFCQDCSAQLQVNCLGCQNEIAIWVNGCGACGAQQTPLVDKALANLKKIHDQAESLLADLEFDRAVEKAAVIASETDSRLQQFAAWYEDFSTRLEASRTSEYARLAQLLQEALTHEQAYDYEAGLKTLQQIAAPLKQTTLTGIKGTAKEITKRLTTKQARLRELEATVRERVTKREITGLLPIVDELLTLKPDRPDLIKLQTRLVAKEQAIATRNQDTVVKAKQYMSSLRFSEVISALNSIPEIERTDAIESLIEQAETYFQKRERASLALKEADESGVYGAAIKNIKQYLSEIRKADIKDAQLQQMLDEAKGKESVSSRNKKLIKLGITTACVVVVLITGVVIKVNLDAKAVEAEIADGNWETVLELDSDNADGLRMQAAAKAAMEKYWMEKAAEKAAEKVAAVINNVYTEQSQWIDPTKEQYKVTRDARLSITHVWLDSQQTEQPILNIVIKIENRNKSTELSLQRQFAIQNAADRPPELSPYVPLIRLATSDGHTLDCQAELANRTIPLASEISETYQFALTVEQATELDHVRVLVPKAWFNKLGYFGFEIPQFMITSTKLAQNSVQIARDPITNSIGMTLNKIPAGSFLMGSPEIEKYHQDDEFQHKVTISKAFYMQTTEVTQGQWKSVMGTEPWKRQRYFKEGDNYPAQCVSGDDAVAYCKKLSEKEGKTYRLPTEAEWEYACRAGTKTTWSFGDDDALLGQYAWYGENAQDIDERYAHQGGLKKPNAFGLYDMHGNVREWCHDYYVFDYYKQSPENDPTGPACGSLPGPVSGSFRVMRGGSWGSDSRYSRSAVRGWGAGNLDVNLVHRGFRVVRELD
jgi:formylglycine-generating enzyme required for sulfatase activity